MTKPEAAADLRLSVVIPAFNEAALIDGCLSNLEASLASAGLASRDYEILVVDNDSSDDTATRAARHGARVLKEPVRQIARARNCGGRAARGPWILFLDADSWPEPALIGDMLRHMELPGVAGGGALVIMDDVPALMALALGAWNLCSRVLGWASGAFIFCRRADFEAVGGFDERLFAGEEISFSRRLKRHARPQGRRLVILSRHPLLTSARRARLYSTGELVAMAFRLLRHPVRFFRDPSLCSLWYDGRR